MRISRIRSKLQADEVALVVTLHFTDPSVYELTSLLGFDGIWMDMEHHTYSVETAAELMRAARVGTSDILARPAKGEFARLSRMLEAGAQGIMYPRCESAEEAAQVVEAAKFAPLGRRGFDSGNPDNPYCTMPIDAYVREANEQTFVLIQLEDQPAVDRAEEILAVEGVDAIMLGPADFTVLSGIPGQFDHPLVTAAVEKIARAAQNTGKHWASTAASIAKSREMIELGARIILHNADLIILKQGLERMRDEFQAIGVSLGDVAR